MGPHLRSEYPYITVHRCGWVGKRNKLVCGSQAQKGERGDEKVREFERSSIPVVPYATLSPVVMWQ